MADVWLPGATRDPGRNSGYNSGRSQMIRAVAHYTVGADSRNVGRDGYFHFLVHRDASREGGCTQYAEVDAVTWHAADAGNPYGPGVEWERMTTGGMNAEGLSNAEPLTANQIEWGSRLVDFFAEWGITPALYDGPRYQHGGWRGWVNHQAIDSSRSDGLLRAEWDQIAGGGSPGAPGADVNGPEDETMLIVKRGHPGEIAVLCGNHRPRKIPSVNDYLNGPVLVCDPAAFEQYFADAIALFESATR